jgi:hypothetical protein
MLEQKTTSLLPFGAGKHHAAESPGCSSSPGRRASWVEIARRVGLAAGTLTRDLKRLADFGLLNRERSYQLVYSANRQCSMFEPLILDGDWTFVTGNSVDFADLYPGS